MKVTIWGWYWLVVWFGIGFLAPEVYWIYVKASNTLSDNFWAFEHIDRKHPFDLAEWTPLHYGLGIILLVFVIWLFWHLIFGLFGLFSRE